jgi:hypothetical protein
MVLEDYGLSQHPRVDIVDTNGLNGHKERHSYSRLLAVLFRDPIGAAPRAG